MTVADPCPRQNRQFGSRHDHSSWWPICLWGLWPKPSGNERARKSRQVMLPLGSCLTSAPFPSVKSDCRALIQSPFLGPQSSLGQRNWRPEMLEARCARAPHSPIHIWASPEQPSVGSTHAGLCACFTLQPCELCFCAERNARVGALHSGIAKQMWLAVERGRLSCK